jgi:hypothetical protein
MFDAINQLHPRNRSAEADKLFKAPEWKLIDDKAVKFSDVAVHSFTMGDVEDPDLYAAQPIYEWQQSEMGQWVMEHAVETPFWHRHVDPYSYGYKYFIIARLSEQDQTYWALKWQKS